MICKTFYFIKIKNEKITGNNERRLKSYFNRKQSCLKTTNKKCKSTIKKAQKIKQKHKLLST